MFCLNGSSCLNEDKNILTLPIIGAIINDLSSLRLIYFCIFLVLILIGIINNIFSLMTFIRERIRYTISGIYLILYSICSLTLMLLILTNLLTIIYHENYIFHLWTCHGYPYLSSIMVYTSILISAAIAIEGVLIKYFDFHRNRPRKLTVMISILILIIVSLSNLDKILARRLIINQFGHYSCRSENSFFKIFNYIYIILPCSIHFLCLIWILSIRTKKNCWEKLFLHQNNIIPSLWIILCLLLNIFYRLFYFPTFFKSQIHFHIGFLCLFYLPQIFTYMIYVLPDDFYVKEFYQIWFYQKLCCCFYNKKRHVQEFVVIHQLWQRRTSLETIKTITNLDEIFVESEFYKK
jgi:hypothetical protein